MDAAMLQKMRDGKGFIAALDQSGGSTPKALRLYGVEESEYSGDAEMFDLIHEMRTRIITSPVFTGDRILGSILFGLATPSEAASIGALGGIVLAFAYRAMTWQRMRESVYLTVRTTAMVCAPVHLSTVAVASWQSLPYMSLPW